MKKSTILTLALSFFIAGSVTQQAQAISISPKIKRILGAILGGYAVSIPVTTTYACFNEFDDESHSNLEKCRDVLFVIGILPMVVPALAVKLTMNIDSLEKELLIPMSIVISACCAFGSYKLFKSAEQQEKEEKIAK